MRREYDVDFVYEEVELRATASMSPYRPATMYAKNGDPGDPAEGGEVEDLQVWLGDIDITEIVSKKVLDYAEQEIADYAAEYE
jgi:hypothetical protein